MQQQDPNYSNLNQVYDPFDQVLLVKGIDNQILTSFRTLKGENNTVSDTLKIVHGKFTATKHQQNSRFFKSHVMHMA